MKNQKSKIKDQTADKDKEASKASKKSSEKSSNQTEPTTMEELLAQSGYTLKGIKKGDVILGTITFVSAKQVRVDVGGKTEAVVHEKELEMLSEFKDEFREGTQVKILVINPESEHGQPVVSVRQAALEKRWDTLVEKQKSEELIQVLVSEQGKGGFLVTAFGIRGFLPFSQSDQALVSQKEKAYGRRIKVKVLEVEKDANRLVVSQRFAGAEGSLGRQLELLEKIKIGSEYEAEITGIVPFGAFAKIVVGVGEPPIEGLIHISEVAWEKVEKVDDHLKTGQKKMIKVIGVDKKSGRLTLSLKQMQPDPWTDAAKAFEPEQQLMGTVTRITPYGVFIKLMPGIEGLVHISKISPGEEPKVGAEVRCIVEEVEADNRKISLSLVSHSKPVGYR